MRIFLLDSGTMMIDRSQLLWNVDCGVRLRFPVYSVLVEHADGLFLFDTGYDLEHVKAVLPFELPEQTEEQTIPAQLDKVNGYIALGKSEGATLVAGGTKPAAA